MHKLSLGLLASIALRMDHSFGLRRLNETVEQYETRQFGLLSDAKRAYDEITGAGFYTVEEDGRYSSLVLPIVQERFNPLLKEFQRGKGSTDQKGGEEGGENSETPGSV